MSGECPKCDENPFDCICYAVEETRLPPPGHYRPEWGYHNLMVVAAFRYCLGRRSYIVGSCVDWLIRFWNAFDDNSRNIILKETKEALDKGDGGDNCDVAEWKRLLKHGTKKK